MRETQIIYAPIRHLLWIAIAFMSACDGSMALDGILDYSKNEFSAVVRLSKRIGGQTATICSGAVLTRRLVLTARHCIARPGDGDGMKPNDLFIHFRGLSGQYVRTTARHIISVRGKTIDTCNVTGLEREQCVYLAVRNDIALIIPEGDIIVRQKLSTVLDDDLPFRELIKQFGDGKRLTKSMIGQVLERFSEEVSTNEAVVAGYGLTHGCEGRATECVTTWWDIHHGRVQFNGWRIMEHIGRRPGAAFITGKGLHDTPPIDKAAIQRLGDSGSPLLFPHPKRKSELVVAGTLFGGPPDEGWYVSLFDHVALFDNVINSSEYKRAMSEPSNLGKVQPSRILAWAQGRRGDHIKYSLVSGEFYDETTERAVRICSEALGRRCALGGSTTKNGCVYMTGYSFWDGRELGFLIGSRSEVSRDCRREGFECVSPPLVECLGDSETTAAPAETQPSAEIFGSESTTQSASQSQNVATYRVSLAASGGVLNMRKGPGQGHPLIVGIPVGATGVKTKTCRPADDNKSRFPWCEVEWRGFSGWVSKCCLVAN